MACPNSFNHTSTFVLEFSGAAYVASEGGLELRHIDRSYRCTSIAERYGKGDLRSNIYCDIVLNGHRVLRNLLDSVVGGSCLRHIL
jgi:hypothetical protein